MQCQNCGKVFPTTPEQELKLRAAAQVFSEVMVEIGMPVWDKNNNPLLYLDGNLSCCLKPNVIWGHPQEEA